MPLHTALEWLSVCVFLVIKSPPQFSMPFLRDQRGNDLGAIFLTLDLFCFMYLLQDFESKNIVCPRVWHHGYSSSVSLSAKG